MSYTKVIRIAYLASPDLSGTLGIIIYFLCRKYPACKAVKVLNSTSHSLHVSLLLPDAVGCVSILSKVYYCTLASPTLSVKALYCQAVHPSRSFVQIGVLPRYLMNALNDFDKTDREYALARADDLVRFWTSKVKVTAGHGGDIDVDVDALASKCIFLLSTCCVLCQAIFHPSIHD